MVKARHLLAAAACALALSAAPAQAGWWGGDTPSQPNPPSSSVNTGSTVDINVPEPGNFGLFMAGVIGLAIGRRSSRIRRKRKTDGTA